MQPHSNLYNTIDQSTDVGEIEYDEIEFMDRPKDLEGTNFNCWLLEIILHKMALSPVPGLWGDSQDLKLCRP